MNVLMKMALVALSFLALQTVAQEQDNFVPSDVLGMFANQGAVGSRAGTLAVTEAHRECVSRTPSGFEKSESNYQTDYYDGYRACMSTYVPFRVAGDGAVSACPGQVVTWGECSASLPDGTDGTLFSARNTFNSSQFEGVASYQCSGSDWQFVGGGCSAAVESCEAGQIVSWGTTSPLWADADPATEFVDRFGVVRHAPKGRCYSRMPAAFSGELLFPKATSNEMKEPERFDLNASVSAQRCFDSSFLAEPASRSDVCGYIPRSCPPTEYSHPSGCGFSIPSGEHNGVFTAINPSPQNSVGTAQAHCWDGEWEIKSSFCEQSCSATVSEKNWAPGADVGRVCSHPDEVFPGRIPPSSTIDILNEITGMQGSVTYECRNGTIVEKANSCQPESCDVIEAASVSGQNSICSHNKAIIGSLAHGADYTLVVNDIIQSTGEFAYTCQFGEMVIESSSCTDPSEPACNASDTALCGPVCIGDPELMADTPQTDVERCAIDTFQDGVSYDNGLCCFGNGPRNATLCYQYNQQLLNQD
jgi:hypothetical protein